MMTKHLTLLLLIGLPWGQVEAERFVKGSQGNINQQNIDNYNIIELTKMTIADINQFLSSLILTNKEKIIADGAGAIFCCA